MSRRLILTKRSLVGLRFHHQDSDIKIAMVEVGVRNVCFLKPWNAAVSQIFHWSCYEVMNAWMYNLTLTYAFVTWCVIKHMAKFTFHWFSLEGKIRHVDSHNKCEYKTITFFRGVHSNKTDTRVNRAALNVSFLRLCKSHFEYPGIV